MYKRQVKRNDKWKKRHYIEEANTKKGRKKRIKMVIAINLMKAFYQVLEHLFPKKGKNILLMSETKDYLWGNLLYIDKRLKERGPVSYTHLDVYKRQHFIPWTKMKSR